MHAKIISCLRNNLERVNIKKKEITNRWSQIFSIKYFCLEFLPDQILSNQEDEKSQPNNCLKNFGFQVSICYLFHSSDTLVAAKARNLVHEKKILNQLNLAFQICKVSSQTWIRQNVKGVWIKWFISILPQKDGFVEYATLQFHEKLWLWITWKAFIYEYCPTLANIVIYFLQAQVYGALMCIIIIDNKINWPNFS